MTHEALKSARASLGLTQTEWGRMLGVTRDAVCKMEAGQRKPSASVVILIDIALTGRLPSHWDKQK